MLAFDLDGVFISDVQLSLISERSYQYPVFNPDFKFYIITGRPQRYKTETVSFLKKRKIKPVSLFHDNDTLENSAKYKKEVINRNKEIKVYFESCPRQAEYLKRNTKANVYLFSEVINTKLRSYL